MLNLKNYFILVVIFGFTTIISCVPEEEPMALIEHLRNLQISEMDLLLDAFPEFWESLEQREGIFARAFTWRISLISGGI